MLQHTCRHIHKPVRVIATDWIVLTLAFTRHLSAVVAMAEMLVSTDVYFLVDQWSAEKTSNSFSSLWRSFCGRALNVSQGLISQFVGPVPN